MKREYYKWWSPALRRDMELLVFGRSGSRIVFFPTRTARFFDYENWGVFRDIYPRIEAGQLQFYCVDSIDTESFYSLQIHPRDRIIRHLEYENYILNEVIPLTRLFNKSQTLIAAGCSMGAYHALNIALRHPDIFNKTVGMSGRYDLTRASRHFRDLLDGYYDMNIYYNMPSHFIPNIKDRILLEKIAKMEIILAIGEEDEFLPGNLELNNAFHSMGINSKLYIWQGEAHKAKFWRKMITHYL